MKTWYFDDLNRRFRISQLVNMEDELIQLEKSVAIRKLILKVSETREDSIDYWNNHTPQERANFGKSQDEIENGDNAKFHSPITFENVASLRFEELPDFMAAAWLSGTSDYFTGSVTNTPKTQHEEAQT